MVSTKLKEIYDIRCSHTSLLNFLKRSGLIRARPATKRLLSDKNIKARKHWLVAYDDQNWDQVLFTDETSIEVATSKPRLVTRPKGPRTKFRRACLHIEYPGDRNKIMFWTAVGKGYKSDLIWAWSARHQYPGEGISWDKGRSGFNAEAYAGIILGPLAQSYGKMVRMHRNCVVLEDNAPVHNAKAANEARKLVDYERLEHPPNSPDLNIIENCWSNLKARMRKMEQQPTTVAQMFKVAQECWAAIPQKEIDDLVDSMPFRMKELKRAKGN